MDRIQPQPFSQATRARPQPRFGNALMAGVDVASRYLGVDWLARNIYGQGDHIRYAFEQTAGLTAPRTVQQLYRTQSITGKKNKIAALEMLIRDLAADFTDTFLPGILATLVIGKWSDRRGDSLVNLNMGRDAVDFYQAMAQGIRNEKGLSYQGFLDTIETVLVQSNFSETAKPLPSLRLQTLLSEIDQALSHGRLKKSSVYQKAGAQLAAQLGMVDTDLSLPFRHAGQSRTLELTTTDLLRDLWQMRTVAAEKAASPEWGKTMGAVLQKTRQRLPRQFWANGVALAGSLSIPFLIRRMTQKMYGGQDAFPGTKDIADHFDSPPPPNNSVVPPSEPSPKTFKWFPYLDQTRQQGNFWPTALTGLFFGALLAIPYYRNFLRKKLPVTLENIAKMYEFDRSFPWTTVNQMEMTYGLLCGIRLLSSRDKAEFREVLTRDCLMGWPALTYFFPMFNTFLANKANNGAIPGLKNLPLLIKRNNAPRPRQEITEALFKNLDLQGQDVATVVKRLKTFQGRLTVAVAATSIAVISLLVPQLNIWATNREEVEKRQGKPRPLALSTVAMGSAPAQRPAMPAVPAVVSLNNGPSTLPSPWVMGPVPAWIPVQPMQNAFAFSNSPR